MTAELLTFRLFSQARTIVLAHCQRFVRSHDKKPVAQTSNKVRLVVDRCKHQLVVRSQYMEKLQKTGLVWRNDEITQHR